MIASILEKPDDSEEPPSGDVHYTPDEIKFDEKGKKGKKGKVQMESFSNEQLSEMWMRRLSTTPADFLRFRFALERAETEEAES